MTSHWLQKSFPFSRYKKKETETEVVFRDVDEAFDYEFIKKVDRIAEGHDYQYRRLELPIYFRIQK